MTKEQINEDLKQHLLENHKNILKDICMNVHNCADCFDESTRKVCCNPHVDTFHVSKNAFYIESYGDSRTNKVLLDMAEKYGYEAGVIFENGICMIKYWKR